MFAVAVFATMALGAPPPSSPDWDEGVPRWFAAGRFDAGAIVKASGLVGYGQPFWLWMGFQATATTSLDFFAATGGIRFSLPIVELTIDYRHTEPYVRGPLDRRASYDSDMVNAGPRGGYDAVDFDLWGVVPLPYSYIFVELSATWLPDEAPRYDELARIVVEGWSGGLRGAFGGRIGEDGWVRFGVIAEMLVSERPGEPVVRVGPSLQIVFTRHTDLVMALLFPVASQDSMQFLEAATGAFALRWRLVTGEDKVEFP